MTDSVYSVLSKIDVSEFTEKKGQFTYLSWANAVDILLQNFPEATWDVIRNEYGLPYVSAPQGAFVTVWVEIAGIKRTICHPVLDYRNKSVVDPDSFTVNTSIQRALAKAISLHGLGLYIYRGEDLPEAPEQVSPEPIRQDAVDFAVTTYREILGADEAEDFAGYDKMQAVNRRLSNDERIAVANAFGDEKNPDNKREKLISVVNKYLNHKPADEAA